MFTTFLWLNVILSCFKQLPLNSTLVLVPSQSAIIGPQDISRTSSSNIHRRSPKGPTWPSRGHPDLTSRERPNLTFWVRPNLTFKGRPWEVDLGRPLEDLQSAQTWMFQHFWDSSFRTYSIDQIYLKAFRHSRCCENPVKLQRWSIFCNIS